MVGSIQVDQEIKQTIENSAWKNLNSFMYITKPDPKIYVYYSMLTVLLYSNSYYNRETETGRRNWSFQLVFSMWGQSAGILAFLANIDK